MIIAVDFDGVLHDYENPVEGRRMGEPLPGAKDAMERLELDHQLIVYTNRGMNPQHVQDWLEYYDVPYDTVTNLKPNADVYIDDKAIRHISWPSTLMSLKGLGFEID